MKTRIARRIVAVALTAFASAGVAAGPGPAPGATLEDLDAVLERFVDGDGRVDYAGLLRGREPLDRFVDGISRVSPDSHPDLFDTDAARLAYWMNAYNALMLRRVIDAWPIETVRDIKPLFGVFWAEKHALGGDRRTLRSLENKIIRDRFDEPRIHFGINCASGGCPPLPPSAWRPGSIDEDLDRAARRFVENPDHVRIDLARGEIHLSSIFKWYEEDFTGWMERRGIAHPLGIVDYVLRYLPPERIEGVALSSLKVVWIDYDWSINAQ